MTQNSKQKMKETVDQYYLGNFQFILDHVTEDINWISHKMSNVQIKNKKELQHFFENVPVGCFTFEHTRSIIADNNVVVEGICRYANKDGKQIESFFCDIFTFRFGKIEKVSSYFV
ncbi:MAG: nuclear transport factor 2 family protein [Crocinitomicaceae bacterium]|nr:nuclear transport factor 2 family protein [Crocinitomicaceae bacterium]